VPDGLPALQQEVLVVVGFLLAADVEPELDPATDICQVDVQVRNSNGASAESKILPEYTGLAVGGSGEEVPARSPAPEKAPPNPKATFTYRR
jgi:hypothetical protein